jgi:hypothetical protein
MNMERPACSIGHAVKEGPICRSTYTTVILGGVGNLATSCPQCIRWSITTNLLLRNVPKLWYEIRTPNTDMQMRS